MRRLASTQFVIALFVLSLPMLADTVYLKNGQIYTNCKARFQPDGTVEIRLPGGRLLLPAAEVAYVEYEYVPEEALEASAKSVLSPVLERLLKKAGEQKQPVTEKLLELEMRALADLLASEDAAVRRRAGEALRRLGKNAVPYMLPYLYDDNGFVRNAVSEVVAELADQSAIKPLLEAIYAASPEHGPVRHYLVAHLLNIRNGLRRLTGQNFAYRPDTARQEQALKQWLAWYNENMLKLPPQIGEPSLDPKDPEYKKKLLEARQLNLKKHDFRLPSAPVGAGEEAAPEATSGEAAGAPAEVPAQPAATAEPAR